MGMHKTQLSVNDYLDLFIYAGSMNDKLWQKEIIEKLLRLSNEIQTTSSEEHFAENK